MMRFHRLPEITLAFMLVGLGSAQTANAQQTCRNNDYKGVFGALALGDFIITPPGIPPGPTARVAKVESDGNGNAHISATLSLNGAIFKEEYGGTYTVNPDCSIDVTLLIPFPGAPAPIPFRFTGMLANDGNEAAIILVDPPGSTVRILLRKQRRHDCTSRELVGSYLLNMSGTNVFQAGTPLGLFARVGKLEFDGIGVFNAQTRASYGGQLVPETFSGVYLVDSSCNLTMYYRANGQQYTWTGILTDKSSSAYLLVSDPQGAVITANLSQK